MVKDQHKKPPKAARTLALEVAHTARGVPARQERGPWAVPTPALAAIDRCRSGLVRSNPDTAHRLHRLDRVGRTPTSLPAPTATAANDRIFWGSGHRHPPGLLRDRNARERGDAAD
eukprot:jgi/Tetstr1/447978/TSEL_035282.t1